MIAIGFLGAWAFYAAGSWGWVLVKGYNITLREWISPVNTYQWPAGGPQMVPQGSLFPTRSASGAGTGGTGTTAKIQTA